MVIRGTEIRRRDPASCNLFPAATLLRSIFKVSHPASVERSPVVSHNTMTDGGVTRYRSAAIQGGGYVLPI